jgi:tetratricopeptide (TPR) repeat protein
MHAPNCNMSKATIPLLSSSPLSSRTGCAFSGCAPSADDGTNARSAHPPLHLDPLELNNAAISQLQGNRYEEALRLLEQALVSQAQHEQIAHERWVSSAALSSFSLQGQFLLESLSTTFIYDATFPCITSAPADASAASVVGVQNEQDLVSSPSNHFALYNRAFLFDANRVAALGPVHRVRIVPAVLLYNMGLVFHRKALATVSDRDAYRRATIVYHLALSILEENLCYGLYSSDCSLLQLALYNNMGFISSHFFEDRDSTVCACRLLSTFAAIDSSRLLSKDEYVFYYMNLLFLMNRAPIVAPAA